MRTTLALEDDILAAARHLAEREGKTVGAVISSLARLGLARSSGAERAARNGIPLLRQPGGGKPGTAVTLALVNQLRDEAP